MSITAKLNKYKRFVAWNRPWIWLAALSLVAGTLSLSSWANSRTTPSEARREAVGRDTVPPGSVDCRKVACVALTFDGGPGKDTPRLLDILAEKQVPATFFLLGRRHIERYPDVVREIAADGHEIASHTWTHRVLTELEPEQIRWELARTQRALEKLTGQRPALMRPPQGYTDAKVSKVCAELGLAQVLWSVTAKDYATTDSRLITRRVLEQTERDGIILLHDIYPGTVPAVPAIIDELARRGFTFVTVTELLAPGAPKPGAVYKP
ncbi:MAG TPA: polysaccharide deacetylase family protein [Actinopolymorphaceae bacterium]